MQNYDVDADVEDKFPKVWANLLSENCLTAQEQPIAVLLGGQPGAGKSFGSLTVSKRLGHNVLFINGDEFRSYHRFYDEIYATYGKDASKYTGEFTGKMVQKVREQAIAERFNLIIEGTFRTAEIPLAELKNFKQKGYRTGVIICTCDHRVSWQSTLKRAEEQLAKGLQPRYVPKEHYDLVVHALADNAYTVFTVGNPDRFEIYSRTEKLFDSTVDNGDIVEIINRTLAI